MIKHRDLVKLINVDKECRRCTNREFARQIEELVLGHEKKTQPV